MPDYPKIGVAVIVCRDGKILLQRRLGEHGYGKWCNPGGHLEMFEDPLDAGLRELREEAGSEIHIGAPIFWRFENTLFPEENKHYVVLFYVVESLDGEAINMEPEKGGEWEWFDWNDLPQPLMPGTQQIKDKGLSPFLEL